MSKENYNKEKYSRDEISDENVESIIFAYIDKFKFLFFPEKWSSVFLDFSKNEILAILLIYKNEQVSMGEVAEYISAPLNTATGVISRLEKKKIIERKRDLEDKRIVRISFTEEGKEFIKNQMKTIEYYFKETYKILTQEEIESLLSVVNKAIHTLKTKDYRDEDNIEIKPKKVKRINIE